MFFRVINVVFIIIYLLLNSFFIYSQRDSHLLGNWLNLNDVGVYTFPSSVVIMKISETQINFYDFDQLSYTVSYFSEKGDIINNNEVRNRYSFLGEDVLMLDFSNAEAEKSNSNSTFIRLKPTQFEIDIEDILNNSYSIDMEDRKGRIIFNKELPDSLMFNLGNRGAGNLIKLEQFEDTYFISIYALKYRCMAIPVKSFEKEKIIMYGFGKDNLNSPVVAKKL